MRLHASLLLLLLTLSLLSGCASNGNGAQAVNDDSDMQTVWGSSGGSGKPINGPEQDHSSSSR